MALPPVPAPLDPRALTSLSDWLLVRCEELNRLELAADAAFQQTRAGGLHGAGVGEEEAVRGVADHLASYKQALQEWRWATLGKPGDPIVPGAPAMGPGLPGRQPGCRTEALAVALCKDGANREFNSVPRGGASTTWRRWMFELSSRQRNESDCREFPFYYGEEWKPRVFHWPVFMPSGYVDDVWNDPDYGVLYRNAADATPPSGPPQVPWVVREAQGKKFHMRAGRMIQLYHVRVLHKTLPQFPVVQRAQQVVEFGGGGGDLPVTLRDLGYAGTHFVYDLPPMLLLQRYWLRYSGIPAFLGIDLPPNPEDARGHIVLESAMQSEIADGDIKGGLIARLDFNEALNTLFIAAWSLTEADHASRAKAPARFACRRLIPHGPRKSFLTKQRQLSNGT